MVNEDQRRGELGASWLSWLKQKFADVTMVIRRGAGHLVGDRALSLALNSVVVVLVVFQALNINCIQCVNYFFKSGGSLQVISYVKPVRESGVKFLNTMHVLLDLRCTTKWQIYYFLYCITKKEKHYK